MLISSCVLLELASDIISVENQIFTGPVLIKRFCIIWQCLTLTWPKISSPDYFTDFCLSAWPCQFCIISHRLRFPLHFNSSMDLLSRFSKIGLHGIDSSRFWQFFIVLQLCSHGMYNYCHHFPPVQSLSSLAISQNVTVTKYIHNDSIIIR